MRKNVLMSGVIILVIGAALFFGSPYLFKSNLNLSALLPLKNSTTLQPNSSLFLGSVSPGYIFIGVYNDTPLIAIKIIGTNLNVTKVDGYFVFESYNSGSSPQSIYALNNYSQVLQLYYSDMTVSASSIVYSTLMVLLGGVLMIVGGIIIVVGLFLRPKIKSELAQS